MQEKEVTEAIKYMQKYQTETDRLEVRKDKYYPRNYLKEYSKNK